MRERQGMDELRGEVRRLRIALFALGGVVLGLVLLGAGGSAKAVAMALLQAGAVAVQLSNRTEARAKALVEALTA